MDKIHADIHQAHTLSTEFYRSEILFEEVKDDNPLRIWRLVESVQNGIQSRYYQRGRFSPKMEKCVHHFHRLVSRFLNEH